MTIHEIRTPLTPVEVIERARTFFALAADPAGRGRLPTVWMEQSA